MVTRKKPNPIIYASLKAYKEEQDKRDLDMLAQLSVLTERVLNLEDAFRLYATTDTVKDSV